MEKKSIVMGAVEMIYGDDNIYRYRFLDKSNITLEVASAIVAVGDEWSDLETLNANLVDTREMNFIDSAARKYLAEQERPNLCGIAIVINSKFQTALANLYFKIAKPRTQTKLFENIPDAEAWLKAVIVSKEIELSYKMAK